MCHYAYCLVKTGNQSFSLSLFLFHAFIVGKAPESEVLQADIKNNQKQNVCLVEKSNPQFL